VWPREGHELWEGEGRGEREREGREGEKNRGEIGRGEQTRGDGKRIRRTWDTSGGGGERET
jgi:hypothetical protein